MALQTFQENFYLTQNPDVFAAVRDGLMTAEEHYVKYGELEGRQPNPYFNPAGYMAVNQDVVPAVASGIFSSFLSHFELNGAREGRSPGADTFNEANYLAANEDVKAAVDAGDLNSGYEHYVLYGAIEGRANGIAENPDPTQGQTFTLTVAQDLFPEQSAAGNAGADVIRGVAGQIEGAQDQTTLNSSDILDGGASDADKLVVNMTGTQYLGGATVKNIETLQIGTNLTNQEVAFDMNVNQGSYEVTSVNKLVYDQITNTETLVVQNVVPVAVGDVAPDMVWANENGSAAGTIATTYRQATIDGTADNQTVELINVTATQHVIDGVLAIGGGMEQLTIISSGEVAQNTLNNSNVEIASISYGDTGSRNDNGADLLSKESLTSVVLKGATAIGEGADVIGSDIETIGDVTPEWVAREWTGLTDRWASVYRAPSVDGGIVASDDGGISNSFGDGTASNLLSVGSRVTKVDASEMTANTFVRFAAKSDESASDKTFIGGTANDYVEFENGNVTATGDTGEDTFAFINGQPNSTFGENDVLTGGEDSDTILLGMNGFGDYTVAQTEFRNKTAIDVLDLRGNTSNVTLSSEFVSSADEGRITVHTDRIVRTALDNNANLATHSDEEDNSVHIVDLTFLGAADGITFHGGSGSDRLVLNDATFNVQQVLDGGVFTDYANRTGFQANTEDYDTLTVITNGEQVVLDAQDLSQITNFNGLILTKNSETASYSITLTRSFLSANTLELDDATNTNIDDTIFQVGTIAAANQSILSTGDTVMIDVSDLLSITNNAKSTPGFIPGFDVKSLTELGVNPIFLGNGGEEVALSTLEGLGLVRYDTATARNDVLVSAPNVKDLQGNTLTAQAANFDTTSGFLLSGGLATAQDDVLNTTAAFLTGSKISMAGGTDTLNITDDAAGKDASGLATADAPEIVNLKGGATGLGFTNANGAGFEVNASVAAVVHLGNLGQIFNGSVQGDFVTGGTGADSIDAGSGDDAIVDGLGNDTIDAGAGADVVDITVGDDIVYMGSGDGDVLRVTLSGNDTVYLGAGADDGTDNVVILNTNSKDVAQIDTAVVTINDFSIASDKLIMASTEDNAVVATSYGTFINNAVDGELAIDASILEISSAKYQYTGEQPDEGTLLSFINDSMGETAADGAVITVVVYNGDGSNGLVNAAIFQMQEDGTVTQEFDNIELVGIVTNVAADSFTAANFS
ncbi:S-layer family protein [Chromatium okenii]|uniref:beta strand repeat-containing protein n=1 Tax=Chromatium okenii TaxID=61644 RepID=UPI0026EC7F25|nr:hypothetical protein [Chromatium okenii]MBV5311389.1 hypothetical protein [Chromatium okenii]